MTTNTWHHCTVADIAAPTPSSIAIGPFGSRMKADLYVDSGVPVIRGTNLSGSRYLVGEFVYVTKETASSLSNAVVRNGDLVFPHRGAIGEVGIIEDAKAELILSTSMMKLTPDREKADPLFLYYYFRSSLGRHELLKNASQVGTPGIATPLTSLRSIRVPCPPLPEQRAIAHILGTLDDKIELNRRMNETLEALARAMFQSWFVDFDPVRARAAGQQPAGMDTETAALFPSSFETSEIGDMPSGWRTATLAEVTSVLSRGITPAYTETDGILVLNQRCIRDHQVDMSKGRRHDFTRRRVDGRLLQVGDGLVNSTGVGTLGRVAPVLYLDEPTVVDSHITVVRANCQQVSSEYLTLYLLSMEPVIEQLGHGSTGQTELSRSSLGELGIVLPPYSILRMFSDMASPLLDQIASNQRASISLAETRDALLPILLSGNASSPGISNALETW